MKKSTRAMSISFILVLVFSLLYTSAFAETVVDYEISFPANGVPCKANLLYNAPPVCYGYAKSDTLGAYIYAGETTVSQYRLSGGVWNLVDSQSAYKTAGLPLTGNLTTANSYYVGSWEEGVNRYIGYHWLNTYYNGVYATWTASTQYDF